MNRPIALLALLALAAAAAGALSVRGHEADRDRGVTTGEPAKEQGAATDPQLVENAEGDAERVAVLSVPPEDPEQEQESPATASPPDTVPAATDEEVQSWEQRYRGMDSQQMRREMRRLNEIVVSGLGSVRIDYSRAERTTMEALKTRPPGDVLFKDGFATDGSEAYRFILPEDEHPDLYKLYRESRWVAEQSRVRLRDEQRGGPQQETSGG